MRFTNIDDVNNYFDGEIIECLECHKFYKHLANHVMMKHHLSINEYKEKYNIPLTYSLASKSYKLKQSKALKKRIATGEFNYNHLHRAIDKAKLAPKTRTKLTRTSDKQNYINLRCQFIKLFKNTYWNEEVEINTTNKKELLNIINKMKNQLTKKL